MHTTTLRHDAPAATFFRRLSLEQVGETLGLARRTIDRDRRFARAFINARMD